MIDKGNDIWAKTYNIFSHLKKIIGAAIFRQAKRLDLAIGKRKPVTAHKIGSNSPAANPGGGAMAKDVRDFSHVAVEPMVVAIYLKVQYSLYPTRGN